MDAMLQIIDAAEDSKKVARDSIGHAKEMELKAVKADKKYHDVQGNTPLYVCALLLPQFRVSKLRLYLSFTSANFA